MDRRSFLAGAAAAWAARRARGAETRPPNIVFVLVDDLGQRDLGCYGSDYYETPNIDKLASEGMRFTNAYAACPVCSPTRASILTGRYPARLHLTDWIPGERHPFARLRTPEFNQQLPLAEVILPQALAPAGYMSASIGKWHLGGNEFLPDRRGFNVNLGGTSAGQPPSYFSPYGIRTLPDGPAGEYLTDRLTDEALRFVEANRERPFFLYLPEFCVHTPLMGKAPLVEHFRDKPAGNQERHNAKYAAMIKSLDEGVGRLLAKLDELGLRERTLVVLMSDNGGLASVTSNAPLRAGKGTLYEGGVREPLLVRWPGRIKPGSVCDEVVTSTDFFPTLLAAAGVEQAQPTSVDGLNLLPLLTGEATRLPREAVYWHYPHYHGGGATPGGAVREGRLKLLEFFEDQHCELYDLEADLGERTDLAAQRPADVARLRARLAAWRAETQATMPTPNPAFDPARVRGKAKAVVQDE